MKKFLNVIYIILIEVLAAAVIATAVSTIAVHVDDEDHAIAVYVSESTFEEMDVLLTPGSTQTISYKVSPMFQANYTISVEVENNNPLAEVINLCLTIGDDEHYNGVLSEVSEFSVDFNGEQYVTLAYSLPLDTGNEYQNIECEVTMHISALEVVGEETN